MVLLLLLQKSFPFTFWKSSQRSDDIIMYLCNTKCVLQIQSNKIFYLNNGYHLFRNSLGLYPYNNLSLYEIVLEMYKKYLLI